MKRYTVLCCLLLLTYIVNAQQTFPVNGTHDPRTGVYAFTHANIMVDYQTLITDATLLIVDGKIEAVGKQVTIPEGVVVTDLQGKFIYPSFIDIYSDYGMPDVKPVPNPPGPQFISGKEGAYNWNMAIKPEINASELFTARTEGAREWRAGGFGSVVSHEQDGIIRGTGCFVLLGDDRENKLILKDKVCTNYSFSKGVSPQEYPSSLMGSIALLRQTFYDAQWYKQTKGVEEYNISLDALNKLLTLPQVFQVDNDLSVLRADILGDEFNLNFIIKGAGDEYKRVNEIKATGDALIIPLNFPKAYDVADPLDANLISLADMMHWELAPTNPAALQKAGITFAITAAGAKNPGEFWNNLRKAILYGLSETDALKALTYTPAKLMNVLDQVGTLEKGKVANFIITSDSIFAEDNVIYQNWVSGKPYIIHDIAEGDMRGSYNFTLGQRSNIQLTLTGNINSPVVKLRADSTDVNVEFRKTDNLVTLGFTLPKDSGIYRLTGYITGSKWTGTGTDAKGRNITWSAAYNKPLEPKKNEKKKEVLQLGKVMYPFCAFGWDTLPKQETVLFKNATVWTNEKDGILTNTDVLIKDGKISQIGKNLSYPGAKIIDATGKNLTSGIIDEHSHIGISQGVNEGSQSVTSEVRIGDVLTSEDINIYRQLGGGVTCSHLLHGSANAIGGQTQLIKLRWGYAPEQLKFAGWPGFIKFALGENVKQSNWGDIQTTRFPQSRTGVEQTFYDGFIRAKDYEKQWNSYNGLSAKLKLTAIAPRRDLELDALVEIMNGKRFITCHSYVQSEINMLMHVADSMHFKVNTFTHILEGYKVADKMKMHGVYASTFADWWAYKYEVYDAIPYNGALLNGVGVITAYNSDDAEMARRLNQEAAKGVKYGNVSEEDAWKFVTLNPAKMLHVDDKVGSIKVGKDADVVLWTDNPLSIYAKPEYTFVDGICFFSLKQDQQKQLFVKSERQRLINKMIDAKKNGEPVQSPQNNFQKLYECDSECDGKQIGGQ